MKDVDIQMEATISHQIGFAKITAVWNPLVRSLKVSPVFNTPRTLRSPMGFGRLPFARKRRSSHHLKRIRRGGNHLDEDVIKMTVNKTIQGAQVTNMITSPDGDVYVRIVAKGVSDYISDKGQREAIEKAFQELEEESNG